MNKHSQSLKQYIAGSLAGVALLGGLWAALGLTKQTQATSTPSAETTSTPSATSTTSSSDTTSSYSGPSSSVS